MNKASGVYIYKYRGRADVTIQRKHPHTYIGVTDSSFNRLLGVIR